MTVSSAIRKAGPFAGNNLATVFPFSFKVFTKNDVKVLRVDASGVSTKLTLDSDYSVQLNANQDAQPGGWVSYPISGSPLPATYELVVLGSLPYDQQTDLTNQGGFYPQTVEDMSDRSTIQIQQLAEIGSRALVIPEVESVSPVLPSAQARANTVVGFDAGGNLTTLPMTPAIGAGDLKNEIWRDGIDYTSGTSTYVMLSRTYGTKANLGSVVMAGVGQDPDSYSIVNGNKLQFDSVIPAGTSKIWCVGGTTLSTYIPPIGSVGSTQLQSGAVGDDQLAWIGNLSKTLDTISGLRGLSKTTHNRAFVYGYYAAGDGGGGPYYLDPTDTTSVDDGGATIVAADGGRWKLGRNAPLSLSTFGAKGDGLADDTAAAQAAINAAMVLHKTLSLYSGNYKITNTLTIGNGTSTSLSTINGICVRGISSGVTAAEEGNPSAPVIFTWAGAAGGTMMQILGPIYGIDLFGFELNCAGIAGTGIHFAHPINSKFDQILIQQYTSIGIVHDAYSSMTGLAVGSQHNLFIDVTAKYPAPGGNGASIGAASLGTSPFLDVAQNVYMNCEFWRDGTSSVTYSLRLQFMDNCTFIDCETTALGANNGVGIYVVPPAGATGFPAACTFINSPIQGGVSAGAGWTANEGLMFWPYPVGDGEPVPSTATPKQVYGITSKGDYFGGLSIGVGNTPILQHISKTFALVFPAVSGQSSSVQAVAIAGTTPGDTVVVAWDEGPFPTGLILSATVAVAGTVNIIWTNVTGGSVTPAGGTYRVDVWKH